MLAVERIGLAAATFFLFTEAASAQAARSRKRGSGATGAWNEARVIAVATLSLGGALAALVAAAQWLYGFDALAEALREGRAAVGSFRDAALARVNSGRVFGPLILPGSLAGLLSLTLPATVALLLLFLRSPSHSYATGAAAPAAPEGDSPGDEAVSRSGWKRRAFVVLLAVAALLQGASLAATGSLAGIASLAIATALTVWFATASTRLRIGLATAAVVAGVAIAGAAAGTRGLGWTSLDDPESPLTLRFGNWKAGAEMISTWPILGTGGGGYAVAYPEFRQPGMNESRHAHNSYLELVVEYGPAVLPSVLLIVFITLSAWLAACREGVPTAVAAIGLPAFLIHNLADFTAYQPSVLIPFAALAGAFHGGISSQTRGHRTGRRLFAYSLLLVSVWGAVAVHAVGDSLADMLIERSATYESRMMPERSLQTAERAALLSPLNPLPFAREAALHLAAGEPADAILPAEHALALDRHTASLHYLSGLSLQGSGRLAEAYVRFSEAERLYPLRADYTEARLALEKALPEIRWRPPDGNSGEPE